MNATAYGRALEELARLAGSPPTPGALVARLERVTRELTRGTDMERDADRELDHLRWLDARRVGMGVRDDEWELMQGAAVARARGIGGCPDGDALAALMEIVDEREGKDGT